jgi:hypothetical protein
MVLSLENQIRKLCEGFGQPIDSHFNDVIKIAI